MSLTKIQPFNIDTTKNYVFNTATATQLVSSASTGTAPFVVTSTTQVANLRAATAVAATTAGTVTTNAQPNITSVGTLSSLSVTGNIDGANITGTHYGNATGLTNIPAGNIIGSISSASTAGTVTTNAQPNITSVGTLANLSVSGNATFGNVTTGLNLIINGSASGNITVIGQATASGTMSVPNGTDTLVAKATTDTLTNKRVTPRVLNNGATTTGTLTPPSDTADQYNMIGLTGSVSVAIPSGTPTDGQRLLLRFKDNGSARTISWVTSGTNSYRVVGATLPIVTTAGKVTYVGCVYNAQDVFWDVVVVGQQV